MTTNATRDDFLRNESVAAPAAKCQTELSTTRMRACVAGLMMLAAFATTTASANVTFSDSMFDLATYGSFGPFVTPSNPINPQAGPIVVTASQCATCGVGSTSALQIDAFFPGYNGQGRMGFFSNAFSYDPSTSGAILSIDASVAKNLGVSADSLLDDQGNSYPGPFGNTFRPLIYQGGSVFTALIFGPNLPAPGETGYQTIASSGLTAADFTEFDFATGLADLANHPDFTGGPMYFGLAQVSNVGPTFRFANELTRVQYDNLEIRLNVPEPPMPALLVLALVAAASGTARRPRTA